MRRNFLFFCLVFLMLPALVRAAEPSPEALVQPLLDGYLKFDWPVMSKLVDDEFVPNKYDFLQKAQKNFYTLHPLSLDLVSSYIKSSGKKIAVKFRWQRTSLEGMPRKTVQKQGEAEFVFTRKDEQWVLYKVSGSDPFGS
ncbi:MAG: hypothetical protein HQL14_08285 [Candidatus Omnitrophica bacterium]|nr:hypothetical protein [Candidatus Omnitrophota bacterium]